MKVYVVQEHLVVSGDDNHKIWVFDSLEKAQYQLNKQVEEFRKEYNSKDYYEDYSPNCYECYEEGCWDLFNYWICIDKREVL